MLTMTIDGCAFRVPQTIEQLTPAQLQQVLALRLAQQAGIEREVLLLSGLLYLLDATTYQQVRVLKRLQYHPDHLIDMLPYAAFMLDDALLRTTCPLGAFELKGTTYEGPGSVLERCTFYEYMSCEQLVRRMVSSPEQAEQLLPQLAAVLYRPATGGNGRDPRTPFDPEDQQALQLRAELFAQSLGAGQLQAVMVYWQSCTQALAGAQQFARVFAKRNLSGKASAEDFGLAGVLDDLAGSLDKWDAIGQRSLYDTLFHMAKRIARAEEREKNR